MKLGGGQIERFLRQPDRSTVLVYGPDQGLVRERVLRLIATVVDDPPDPFRAQRARRRPRCAAIPAACSTRPASLCLLGGRRVVRLRQAGDQATAACRALLQIEPLEALVVIDAGELAAELVAAAADRGRPQRRSAALLSRRGPRPRRARSTGCSPSTASRPRPRRAPSWSSISAPIAASPAARSPSWRSIGEPAARRRRVTLEAAATHGRRQRGARSRRSGACRGRGRCARSSSAASTACSARAQSPVRLVRALAIHFTRLHQLALQGRSRRAARGRWSSARSRRSTSAARRRSARRCGAGRRSAPRQPSGACSPPRSAARPPAGRTTALCRRAALGVCLEARRGA